MNDRRLSLLKEQFEAAFREPFAGVIWQSKKGRAKQIDLEIWRDRLAGPIYSITENGGCAYVYSREDEYFKGVEEPGSLRARLRYWHNKLIEEIDEFSPASPKEAADADLMRQSADAIWAVTAQALEIERERWDEGDHQATSFR